MAGNTSDKPSEEKAATKTNHSRQRQAVKQYRGDKQTRSSKQERNEPEKQSHQSRDRPTRVKEARLDKRKKGKEGGPEEGSNR